MNESISQETFYLQPEQAKTMTRTNNFSKQSVLLIEPDDESRFMFKTLLEMWNYRVLEAKSGDEATILVKDGCPDIILIDTTLQYTETLASFRRLRSIAECGDVPIIFLSGHAQPTLRELVLGLGADDLLVKPVDYDILRKTLRRQGRKDKKRSGKFSEVFINDKSF